MYYCAAASVWNYDRQRGSWYVKSSEEIKFKSLKYISALSAELSNRIKSFRFMWAIKKSFFEARRRFRIAAEIRRWLRFCMCIFYVKIPFFYLRCIARYTHNGISSDIVRKCHRWYNILIVAKCALNLYLVISLGINIHTNTASVESSNSTFFYKIKCSCFYH